MSDDLFRARVERHRAPNPDEVLEELVASVELRRPDFGEPLRADTVEVPLQRGPSGGRRRSWRPWLVAGGALVVAGAGVGFATLGGSPSGADAASADRSTAASAAASIAGSGGVSGGPSATAPSPGSSAAPETEPGGEPPAAAQAADWIAANVGPGHVVACDVTVCALLRRHGFPRASVVPVQSHLSEVEQADVVAVTDVVRRQWGSSLASVVAAEPLAVFTGDSSTIQITPVALSGPSAYADRLAADRATRKTVGAALLKNSRVVVTGVARTALSDGLVDSRVCTLLAVLSGSHTVTVAAFTGPGPGAGPDVPFAGLVISTVDGANAAENSSATVALRTIVNAQRPPYAPLSITPVDSGVNRGLAILFSQPGPTGLLTAAKS